MYKDCIATMRQNSKLFLLVLCGLLFSAVAVAQKPVKIIVIPSVVEGQDICSVIAKDKVLQEAMQSLDEEFTTNGFKVVSFSPMSKMVKARGLSNPSNQEETIKNIVKIAKCDIYIIAEVMTERSGTGNTLALSLTAFEATTGDYITYQTAKTNKFNTTNWGALTKRAFNKIIQPLKSDLGSDNNDVAEVVKKPKAVKSVIETDINIPVCNKKNADRYAVIIGNEDYSSYQMDLKSEVNVDFAERDARIFKEYAVKTFGVPEENIFLLINSRAVEMHQTIAKMNLIIKNSGGNAEVIFYYAGHGFPDEKTKDAYLIPVDVSGTNLQFGVKLKDVYAKLTEYPSKRITVFLDACFSGGARNQGLVAARGVRMKPKQDMLDGNVVVFTASSGEESSLPYKEKQHGIFTYYLLKKIQATKGNITYKELSDYLKKEVGVKSVLVNSKEQTPQTNVSPKAKTNWGEWKIN